MNEWLQSNWHLILFLLIICGIVYRFSKWQGKVIAELNSLGNSMKEVTTDQKSLGNSMKEVTTEQKSMWNSINTIEATIVRILERLPVQKLVEKCSPVHLTRRGKKFSADLSIRNWAEDHAKNLVQDASGKQEYKIFEMCEKYISSLVDEDPDFDEAIRKGAYDGGADVEQLIKVYEVELRDAILNLLDS